jgi:3'(2'), 5'-bisphosphate nucleotidase
MSDLPADLQLAIALAQNAGAAILDVYRTDFTAEDKADGSPITAADRAANAIILDGLRTQRPDDAILSEEAPFEGGRTARTWYVDPLDGTRDFVGKTDDFSVMIGLCIDAQPVLGVVFAPALDRLFSGIIGHGAHEHVAGEAIALRADPEPTEPFRVLASRKHPPPGLARVLARFDAPIRIPRGSVGIKCGLVAAGEADLYLHPSPGTSLWDCCAPQAIATAAGLRFTTAAGHPVPYDPARVANPAGILVAAPPLHTRVLGVLDA